MSEKLKEILDSLEIMRDNLNNTYVTADNSLELMRSVSRHLKSLDSIIEELNSIELELQREKELGK